MKNGIYVSDTFYFEFRSVPNRDCFATERRGSQFVRSSTIVRHVARRPAVVNPNITCIVARMHYKRAVEVTSGVFVAPNFGPDPFGGDFLVAIAN